MPHLRESDMALKQQLIRSCKMLGLEPCLVPEPEVLASQLEQIRCRTLASLIAKLIGENEPCLRAEADGATVTVRVLGEDRALRFTVGESE